MTKFKVKKGDNVVVIVGKDKGKTGAVLKMFPKEEKVLIQGVNIVTKHQRATQTTSGGRIQKETPIHISNISFMDPNTKMPVKLGYKVLESGQKVRFIKSTNEII